MVYIETAEEIQEVDLDQEEVQTQPAGLRGRIQRRLVGVAAGAVFGGSMLVSSVSAEGINWTEIQSIVEGAATIFPSFGVMITGIIGPLMMLGICGAVLYFFDAIIDAVKGAFSFLGRR